MKKKSKELKTDELNLAELILHVENLKKHHGTDLPTDIKEALGNEIGFWEKKLNEKHN